MTYLTPQGPWTVKQLITGYLEADLPRRLVQFREAWQTDDEMLPAPELYLPYEPVGLDHWPCVITVQMSTSQIQRIDYYGQNPIYRCTYNMRTYVWTRHDLPEAVTESRDRLTTVIRAALLDHPCFQKGTAHTGHTVALVEDSLREEFSDITYVKGDRAVAGAYLAYDVTLDEVSQRDDIGEISEISLGIDASGNLDADLEEDLVPGVVTLTIET